MTLNHNINSDHDYELLYDYHDVSSPQGWHSEIERYFMITDLTYTDIKLIDIAVSTPILHPFGNISLDFGVQLINYNYKYSYTLINETRVLDSNHPTDQDEVNSEEIVYSVDSWINNPILLLNFQRKNFMISYIYNLKDNEQNNILFSILLKR